MEELDALNARLGDGFQVACDTLAAHVSVDKVEPRLGIEDAVRMQEHLLVCFAEGTMQQGAVRHGLELLCLPRYCDKGKDKCKNKFTVHSP